MNGRDKMIAWLLSEGERLERRIDLFESGLAEVRRTANGVSVDVTRETLADLKQRRNGLNKLLTEIGSRPHG